MVKTGLEIIAGNLPAGLRGKKVGILCHAPSITSDYKHIIDIFSASRDLYIGAVFGPQHGLSGQTQANMIEWEGPEKRTPGFPVFSLYGRNRKPTPEMLGHIEALIIDLQDVGARLYTYVWTIKLCMEACTEAGIPVWVLDRPNPIGRVPFDGPVLKKEFFTFVGGAEIPLCHRMTIGEMALWIKGNYIPSCDLKIVWMEGWRRNSLFDQTGLPWVLPSPNIPTVKTAIVYPGSVLLEGTNLSEGRGTTIPFELFGAPFVDTGRLLKMLEEKDLGGCRFRRHDFIPTFNKYKTILCNGIQIHVTDPENFHPVAAMMDILDSIIEISPKDSIRFNPPPYEYENELTPFDILSGDSGMRKALINRQDTRIEKERWSYEIEEFRKEFVRIAFYPE